MVRHGADALRGKVKKAVEVTGPMPLEKKMKAGWEIATILKKDMTTAEALLRELPSSYPFNARFERFIEMNPERNPTELLTSFVGQLANCNLKWTSTAVYLRKSCSQGTV